MNDDKKNKKKCWSMSYVAKCCPTIAVDAENKTIDKNKIQR